MVGLIFTFVAMIIAVACANSLSEKGIIDDIFGLKDEQAKGSQPAGSSPASRLFNEAKAAGKQEFSHKTADPSRKVSFNVERSFNDQKVNSKYADEIRRRSAKYRAGLNGYDQSSLDYCDSSISKSKGISFRNKPANMDELAYLAKYNNARENEIIKQMKHSHFNE